MNSPEFTPEPWNWPIWAQREKDIKSLEESTISNSNSDIEKSVLQKIKNK